jgi:ATP-dependent RNA helicase RhlE
MVKKERQTMLFSATMPEAIVKLSKEMLHNPVRVIVNPEEEMIEKIEQSMYYVIKKKKIDLLVDLLQKKNLKSVLVFSRTKHGANRIERLLEEVGIKSTAIHGNKSQNARQKALNGFKEKKIRVLVATDIAARGIDVDELSHVINFDLPDVPETYIHRIGRTGRAGNGGFAISFCSQEEMDRLKDIEKHIQMKIPVVTDSKFSIELINAPTPSKQKNDSTRKKPYSRSKNNKSYSRKRSKNGKVTPKNFSKHDSKNQSRKR